ncbi:MAG: hypothetical protein FWF52_08265 [Candidatus Azobacteroides sp.]|nr:hypothetical protein [Candidatus Azobacteroides sp.]
MRTNLNEILITTILESIPKSIKPVAFLMDSLQLSRESVYRRIRGEIPFSIGEVAQLSLTLGFSLDEIMGGSRKGRAFFDLLSGKKAESPEAFQTMLQKYHEYIENYTAAEDGKSIMALNRLPPPLFAFFNYLFKFEYCKWLHQNEENCSKQLFSDVAVSDELFALQESIQFSFKKMNNLSLIFDPNVFSSITRDIQYFFQRKLIKCHELELLKEELYQLIDFFEEIAKTGTLEYGTKINIYLSPLYINANTCYVETNLSAESIFWVFPANPMFVSHAEVCATHKKWLLSLQRQAVLITLSNEILQSEFFDKQRRYVETHLGEAVSVIH